MIDFVGRLQSGATDFGSGNALTRPGGLQSGGLQSGAIDFGSVKVLTRRWTAQEALEPIPLKCGIQLFLGVTTGACNADAVLQAY